MVTAGASVDTADHLVALCWLYVINVLRFKDAAVSRMHHLKCLRAPCWTCASLFIFQSLPLLGSCAQLNDRKIMWIGLDCVFLEAERER